MTYALRPYQAEAVAASLDMTRRIDRPAVLGVAATGLGKAVMLADLARQWVADGKRVLVLSDMLRLARQLRATLEQQCGPGSVAIEQATNRADHGILSKAPVVLAMVQTLYSGRDGSERFRNFPPNEFGLVIADEAEAFIAPQYRKVIQYFRDGGAALFGCTATPIRSDGVSMAKLFDPDAVAFNLDINWAVQQGYLVPPRMAWLDTHVDFGAFRNSSGDYTSKSIADAISDDEKNVMELAGGILKLAEVHGRTIVFTPTTAIADAIADFLNGDRFGAGPGTAAAVHGKIDSKENDRTFEAHASGEFPILTSAMMLTKGYDDPQIAAGAIARPTKSKRLFIQMMGRMLRLPDPAIGALPDADARRAAIAASHKPFGVVAPMLGLDSDLMNMDAIDVMAGDANAEVVTEAKKLSRKHGGGEVDDLLREAAEVVRERQRREAERRRRAVAAKANTKIEYGSLGEAHKQAPHLSSFAFAKLEEIGVEKSRLSVLSESQAAAIIEHARYRTAYGLCSYKQFRLLEKQGVPRDVLRGMSFAAATELITEIRANNWRPTEQVKRLARQHKREAVPA